MRLAKFAHRFTKPPEFVAVGCERTDQAGRSPDIEMRYDELAESRRSKARISAIPLASAKQTTGMPRSMASIETLGNGSSRELRKRTSASW